MNPYLKITGRTFTIWIMASLINGLLCGISLSVINLNYTEIIPDSIVIFFISLFFSAPGVFIFWIVLLIKIAGYITERALFRTALGTGFVLASATAAFCSKMFSDEFSNHSFVIAACIILSAMSSIMLHFNQIKKIK